MGIHSIQIKNFKSIRDSGEIEINPINVLIGPNGAGKSNFISFLKFLNQLYSKQLQLYVSRYGRAENFLHFGSKTSDFISGRITFNNDWKNEYEFTMVPDIGGNLIFSSEWSNFSYPFSGKLSRQKIGSGGNLESKLEEHEAYRNKYLISQFKQFKIFHFHDTSFNSKLKQPSNTRDYAFFREDGGNLAAFLYRLAKSNDRHFRMIEHVVKSIAPFFDKFYLEPDEINSEQIFLRWYEKGSDQLFSAHNLSDGTLRMICLATLLLQPEIPDTIIIDEPELGLHPFAINKLAALLKSASISSQIIISTQSVNLVNAFSPNDIVVVERQNNQTVFKRQSEKELMSWLEEYSVGELWEKNVLGGVPK
jgi:predicted ATPase